MNDEWDTFSAGLVADVTARMVIAQAEARMQGPVSEYCVRCGAYPGLPCSGWRFGEFHRHRIKVHKRFISEAY